MLTTDIEKWATFGIRVLNEQQEALVLALIASFASAHILLSDMESEATVLILRNAAPFHFVSWKHHMRMQNPKLLRVYRTKAVQRSRANTSTLPRVEAFVNCILFWGYVEQVTDKSILNDDEMRLRLVDQKYFIDGRNFHVKAHAASHV